MKSGFATILSTLLLTGTLTLAAVNTVAKNADERRASASTQCADPSLTTVYVEAYSPANKAHTVNPLWSFVTTDTINGFDWQIQGEIFRAWETPQDSTFPLYEFFNPVTDDVIVQVSTTGSPPNPGSSWSLVGIVGYVYATQICGSVPLLVAFQEGNSDHWYTIDANQHNAFLAHNYTDGGIAAYVLPLNYTTS